MQSNLQIFNLFVAQIFVPFVVPLPQGTSMFLRKRKCPLFSTIASGEWLLFGAKQWWSFVGGIFQEMWFLREWSLEGTLTWPSSSCCPYGFHWLLSELLWSVGIGQIKTLQSSHERGIWMWYVCAQHVWFVWSSPSTLFKVGSLVQFLLQALELPRIFLSLPPVFV